MNFLILGIFLEYSEFIFDFKSFKIIKNNIKRGLIFVRATWCDVALRATWQRHAGPSECLRGAEVTRGCYLYLSYIGFIIYIGLPIIERQIY